MAREASLAASASIGTMGAVCNSRSAEGKKESRRMPRSAPRKSSTKASAGALSSSAGGANWASRPPVRSTATFVPSLIASSMSCVTKTMVLPSSSWMRRSSSWSPLADDGVDGGERLVHQQHRRIGGEGAGHADALLLPAGELVRVPLGQRGVESDPLHQLGGPGAGLLLGPAEQPGHGGDVVDDGAVLEETGVLDDVTHRPAQGADRLPADVLAVEEDGPLGGLHHPVDHPQGRRLAAAGGPDEDGDRAVRYLQRQPVDRDRAVRVPLRHCIYPYQTPRTLRVRPILGWCGGESRPRVFPYFGGTEPGIGAGRTTTMGDVPSLEDHDEQLALLCSQLPLLRRLHQGSRRRGATPGGRTGRGGRAGR